MNRRPLLASLAVALASLCSAFAIGMAVNQGAQTDFVASLRVVSMQSAGAVTVRVQLIVDLQNVSTVAVRHAVLELDGQRPAPTAQSFPGEVSLAPGAAAALRGTFTVNAAAVRSWLPGGRGLPPTLVVVGLDAGGQPSRRAVQMQSFPIGS